MADFAPQLGSLVPDGENRRDAVHIALAPITADVLLRPGDHVGIQDGKTFFSSERTERTIGVVDPFLRDEVKRGERFWLCLYPGTVTSLRHIWTHPVFEKMAKEAAERTMEELKKTVRMM